ncbi:MAG TPA: hypothetical protein VMG10_02250 [Gemmataceae bacterium]|nr:hypothetical protein [Gemmataceae bacterium]
MPITFRCSSCAQILKVPESKSGSKGKCPKCGVVFLIPGAKSEAPQAPAQPAPRKARPPQPAIIEEKAVPKQRRAAEAASNEDDETAEEAAPPVRNVRKKKNKEKKKKSSLLLYGLLGGCFGLALLGPGGGALIWWYFVSSRSLDDLAYMPSGCQTIVSVHMDQLLDSQAMQELRREVPDIDKAFKVDFEKEMGIAASDIEQMLIGMGPVHNTTICVIHTKKPVEARDIRANMKIRYTEKKVGRYVMQEPDHPVPPAFCVVDKQRVLVGDRGALGEVLQRDKKAEFSKNLQAALKQVDFSKTIAVASDKQSEPVPVGGAFPLLRGAPNDLVNAQKKINGFAVQATVGTDVRLDMALLCPDPAAANEVKKAIEGFLNEIKKMIEGFQAIAGDKQGMPKEVADLLRLNLKVEGNKVTGGNTFKVGALLKMYKQQKGQF